MPSQEDLLAQGLLQVYLRAFPTRSSVRVADVHALATDGWESDLYACDIASTEHGVERRDAAVLKLYHGSAAGEKAGREFAGLRHLSQAGFPVPRPLAHATDAEVFGHPSVLMERVAGRDLREAMAGADPPEQRRLLTLFCDLFVRLHALDWRPLAVASSDTSPRDSLATGSVALETSPALGPVSADAAISMEPANLPPPDYLSRWLDFAERHVASLPLPVAALAPVFTWLRERLPTVRCDRLSLTHNDFHPGNVLLRTDGSPVVIDWTSFELADYRLDLAWTLLLASTHGRPDARELILREYERIARYPVAQIEFFDVIACARRLSDIATMLAVGTEAAGMRPEAAAEIRQLAEHVRRVYALLCERIGQPLPALAALLEVV